MGRPTKRISCRTQLSKNSGSVKLIRLNSSTQPGTDLTGSEVTLQQESLRTEKWKKGSPTTLLDIFVFFSTHWYRRGWDIGSRSSECQRDSSHNTKIKEQGDSLSHVWILWEIVPRLIRVRGDVRVGVNRSNHEEMYRWLTFRDIKTVEET